MFDTFHGLTYSFRLVFSAMLRAVKRILITKRRAIGDTVLLTPVFEQLRHTFPDASLSALVPSAATGLLASDPHVQNVWGFSDRSLASWVFFLRAQRFDLHLDFHSTGRTRWLRYFSGAKQSFEHRHDVKTEKRYLPRRPNALEWDQWFLRELPFALTVPEPAQWPRIYLNSQEVADAQSFWQRQGWAAGQAIVLGLGASKATKRWPAAHFAALAALVRDRLERPLLIVSSSDIAEENYTADVLNHMRVAGFKLHHKAREASELIHLANISLRKYAALMHTSACYVGNDSGPKHIAVAVGCPTVTMFGPEDPTEWHPYASETHQALFRSALPCRTEDGGRWCALDSCVVEKHRCMVEIEPQTVLEKLQAVLLAQK